MKRHFKRKKKKEIRKGKTKTITTTTTKKKKDTREQINQSPYQAGFGLTRTGK